MIKNIISDMGGVIIDYNPEKTLYPMLDKENADKAVKEIFRCRRWAEKDRGTIFPSDIIRETQGMFPPEVFEKIRPMIENLYPYMPPVEGMYDFFANVKRNGYGLFLLSNASADFYENKVNIPALSLFDGYLISADYKLLKPEREIYEKLFEKFGLRREECIFIDDVAENVEGSEAAGMPAIRFDGDIAKLRSNLAQYGVNL